MADSLDHVQSIPVVSVRNHGANIYLASKSFQTTMADAEAATGEVVLEALNTVGLLESCSGTMAPRFLG